MTTAMNYDPNMTMCGNIAKQTVRLTFGQWQYRGTMDVEIGGNCMGFSVIDSAAYAAFEKCWSEDDEIARIVLTDADGNTLSCTDYEDRCEDWLKDMLLAAEIISIRADA